MKSEEITREVIARAGLQLEEVFSAFVIVGLPIDTSQEPAIVSTGDPERVRDLLILAHAKKVRIED
jgi:hypothetical protein